MYTTIKQFVIKMTTRHAVVPLYGNAMLICRAERRSALQFPTRSLSEVETSGMPEASFDSAQEAVLVVERSLMPEAHPPEADTVSLWLRNDSASC
ncbi:hypothetical protein K1X84_08565 [bacterium]|nr:hypothetical protein [bacterium]